MSVILTHQQEDVVSEVLRVLEDPCLPDNNLGVLLVGSAGVGMSTSINEVKKTTNRRYLDLKAIDSHCGHGLADWLANILGLEAVRVPTNRRISNSLVNMLQAIGISLLVLEDAHDVDVGSSRIKVLDRLIIEFGQLNSRIPEMKLLMTIQAKEISHASISRSSLLSTFHSINFRRMNFTEFVAFVEIFLAVNFNAPLTSPFTESDLIPLYEYSAGDLGPAVFIMDFMKYQLSNSDSVNLNGEYICSFVSKLKGLRHD